MSNRLKLDYTIKFGKYKGQTLNYILGKDQSYILWLRDNVKSLPKINKEILDTAEEAIFEMDNGLIEPRSPLDPFWH